MLKVCKPGEMYVYKTKMFYCQHVRLLYRYDDFIPHLLNKHRSPRAQTSGSYWQCTICPYFHRGHAVTLRHIRYMHMSVRPHSCPYCLYSTIERIKVVQHVKTVHKQLDMYISSDYAILSCMAKVDTYYAYFVNETMCKYFVFFFFKV